MNSPKEKSGTCTESNLMNHIAGKSYSNFIAFQTDRFIAGQNTTENLNHVESEKLLEIRLFSETSELLVRRTMIGAHNSFQWRIADEENLAEDEYLVRYQTLDIDTACTVQGNNGNLNLTTTGGGRFELPISECYDRIRIISYIGYDTDGMAYIYDDRLAGFVIKGGKGDV